jgi:CRP/FNR family transcriptional regulator, cyclic AMP receptor protein
MLVNIKEVVDVFKQSSIFDGLGESDMKKIAEGCTEQAFPMGTVIIEENDPPREVLYLIKNGEIVVTTGQVGSNSEKDEEGTFITTLGAGDAFGEMALVDEMPHSATVKTISDSIVILLPSTYFFKLVENDNNIGYIVIRNIAKIICSRLRASNFITKHFVQWGVPDDVPES